jgi:transposase InsO family protein
LEDRDRAPKKKRQREITPQQERNIFELRKKYLRYGKEKLALIYFNLFGEKISCWKVQKVIEKYKLYYNPQRTAKIAKKRKRALKKKRITKLKKKNKTGFLICLDVIVIYWNGLKRYIFTAINRYSKLALAFMYKTKSSLSAKDFLLKLNYLFNGKIVNIQHDNDSCVEKEFKRTCQQLGINQYYTRPKTPKDNSVNERFNRILIRRIFSHGKFPSRT